MSQASFAKRQREKDRRERAAAKAAKREERRAMADEPEPEVEPVDEGALLAQLADLHARFADDQIDFDTFTEQKDQITQRLQLG